MTAHAHILEAVLFAAPAPLTPDQLRAALPLDADLGAALADLQDQYQNRGISLRVIDGRYAFRTAEAVAPHLTTYRQEDKKLSRAALETLAVIAYHQPITRPEIENIRGVAVAKGTIDILMELGFVKPGKRREVPGRPLTWQTTPAFLDHFGLSSLTELPGMDDLKASGLLDRRPAIETIDLFTREDAQLAHDAGITDQDNNHDDDIDAVDDGALMPSFAVVAATGIANENQPADDDKGMDDDTLAVIRADDDGFGGIDKGDSL
jgi:segregation and condensation protein B